MGSLQCVRFSPSERQNKSASRREEDRLSSLPDEVLIHILSFVDIKSAVQTSMLISRRNLWTLFPTLNFDLNYLQPSAFSCKFLDRVLTLCSDSTKHVNVSISRTGQHDFKFVKRILNHAFICKVRHLSLNLEKYDVPVSLFPGRYWSIFPDASDSDLLLWNSLTSLRVKCEENAVSCPKAGDMHIPSFLQLTTLHLERPYIVDANFLLSCPNLQNLTLTQSCFSQLPPNLIISASKLSNLNLSYHESSVMYVKLVLEAPNLRLLKLEGPHSLQLVNDTLPYLDTVNINFLSLSPLKEHHEVLTDMLECLHTANSHVNMEHH